MITLDDCKSNLPYPSIEVEEVNASWANLIQITYAGSISEFSAVSQYANHFIRSSSEYPDISQALKYISIVEMHHLEILGKLILKLGGNPGYFIDRNNKSLNWSPNFINYGTTVKEMLAFDIGDEKAAINQYIDIEKKINNKDITSIIDRIILDEELHIQIFYSLYKKHFLI